MPRQKKLNNPVRIDFWINKEARILFDNKFYDAKKLDSSLTKGEFFERILTAMDGGQVNKVDRKIYI